MTGTRAPWTLRRRIVVGTTTLVAAVLVAVGAISVVTLGASLTKVVDTQLTGSMNALDYSVEKYMPIVPDPNAKYPKKELADFIGHAPNTIIALMQDCEIVDSARFTDGGASPLRGEVVTQLETTVLDSGPAISGRTTVELPDLGPYRVQTTINESGQVLIAGVSLATVRQAVFDETVLISILSVLALAITVAGVILVVRLALRPLSRVAVVAADVAKLPLERGEVVITDRVDPADTDPRTEVGQVGEALNHLLHHVDRALAVRAASDKRMRRFVTDASHELRTPLASIQGYAELTRQEAAQLPDMTEHSLARIESEARRMSSLVDDLLLLARLDEGQDLHIDDVDLCELVINAVSDARAADGTHTWLADVPDDCRPIVGDRERLHQLVANLLANARVHTPSGSSVTARLTPGRGTTVLEVIDDGPGIDPELVPELFERFARGDASRSRHSGSTGLGLAIAASIVEAHEGRISVDSRPGRTVFRIELPNELAAPSSVAEPRGAPVPPVQSSQKTH
ncbi:sensor histidine kinase [Agromyces atrinae]|uniref:histidine kinase n=1 Tax=Agromyces atrinae TaxID=592376 RepID=A0A4Q2MCS8_9MICO|nr:HAMP domain-containing sensor histidine kinase [Agromyces atrinae]NYD67989.1 two-component system sensor histidine kinase TrcS [Agromyces atrinae]RXZ87852.1 HAMP domain-containing histidine kinase [Agromyces atrinae]